MTVRGGVFYWVRGPRGLAPLICLLFKMFGSARTKNIAGNGGVMVIHKYTDVGGNLVFMSIVVFLMKETLLRGMKRKSRKGVMLVLFFFFF
jgi:hypothetical protein